MSGGGGTLSSRPPRVAAPRKIEAQFELAGVRRRDADRRGFVPPSARLDRPAGLRVKRRKNALTVSWRRVSDATHFDVVTTLASGEQRKARTRKNKITIARVPTSSPGRVAVRATGPQREGRVPAPARFRATTPRPGDALQAAQALRAEALRPSSLQQIRRKPFVSWTCSVARSFRRLATLLLLAAPALAATTTYKGSR